MLLLLLVNLNLLATRAVADADKVCVDNGCEHASRGQILLQKQVLSTKSVVDIGEEESGDADGESSTDARSLHKKADWELLATDVACIPSRGVGRPFTLYNPQGCGELIKTLEENCSQSYFNIHDGTCLCITNTTTDCTLPSNHFGAVGSKIYQAGSPTPVGACGGWFNDGVMCKDSSHCKSCDCQDNVCVRQETGQEDCKPHCSKKGADWAKKCANEACSGCSQCTANNCKPWCSKNGVISEKKCAKEACSGCSQCTAEATGGGLA